MNKTLKPIIFPILFFLLIEITASCNLPSSAPKNNTETPTAAVSSTETSTPVSTPGEIIPTASATQDLAPLCELTSVPPVQCQIPVIEEGGTFCAKKRPYNLIFINKGLTYDVLTKDFTCSNDGIKDNKQIVTCTGLMASQFEVSVCDPSCVVPTVQASTTQCPPEYNYNNRQGCCMQGFQQLVQNCTVLKLKTISCLVDCSVYKKKATCEQNSIACVWNGDGKKCEARK